MLLDLNDYYCSYKLMLTLVERGRIAPGQTLYGPGKKYAARVRADGSLASIIVEFHQGLLEYLQRGTGAERLDGVGFEMSVVSQFLTGFSKEG